MFHSIYSNHNLSHHSNQPFVVVNYPSLKRKTLVNAAEINTLDTLSLGPSGACVSENKRSRSYFQWKRTMQQQWEQILIAESAPYVSSLKSRDPIIAATQAVDLLWNILNDPKPKERVLQLLFRHKDISFLEIELLVFFFKLPVSKITVYGLYGWDPCWIKYLDLLTMSYFVNIPGKQPLDNTCKH